MVKYAGITAVTLLAVAPIAAPVFGMGTETTVKADVSNVNQEDVQKWQNEIKSTFTRSANDALITNSDVGLVYVVGSDGIFDVSPQGLTPQSDLFNDSVTDDFFMHFNDNSNGDNLFFGDNHVRAIMTATANDGSISGNLNPKQIDDLLEQAGGAGVTFHLSLKYSSEDNAYWADFYDSSDVLATKDVSILPAESAPTDNGNTTTPDTNTDNNNSNQVPGTNVATTFSSSVDATVYDDNGTATSVTLPKLSAWNVDRTMTLNGETYYRVGINEWVKLSDGLEIRLIDAVITTKKQTDLYNAAGKKVSDHALAANTPWRTDRFATINGEKMYRVSTDEWVAASDLG